MNPKTMKWCGDDAVDAVIKIRDDVYIMAQVV
jgi:hypothetical protein